MDPKILVAAPTFSEMKYCQDEFFHAVKNIDYSNYDILIVDNSENNDYFNELQRIDWIKIIRDCVSGSGFEKVVSSRNKIIEYAIENNYDYILMLDSDVIVPRNIIKDLINSKKEVISGLYYNTFVVSNQNKVLPVAWKSIDEKEFEKLKQVINLEGKEAKDLRRHVDKDEIEKGEILEVLYPSAGCLLIKREVFLKARYGLLEVENTSDDIYFFDEIHELGYKTFLDPKIKCEHLTRGKYKEKDGKLVHTGFGC